MTINNDRWPKNREAFIIYILVIVQAELTATIFATDTSSFTSSLIPITKNYSNMLSLRVVYVLV